MIIFQQQITRHPNKAYMSIISPLLPCVHVFFKGQGKKKNRGCCCCSAEVGV